MRTNRQILLVEDDTDDHLFFTEALEKIPNATLYGIAKDGCDALEMLLAAPSLPDLIFMDLNMPLMGGLECLTEIRNHERLCEIPVIILSTSIVDMERLRQLGATAFIKKPSDEKSLRQQLEHAINLDFEVLTSVQYGKY